METECTWHLPKPLVLQQKENAQRAAMDIGDFPGCISVSQIMPKTKFLKCRQLSVASKVDCLESPYKKYSIEIMGFYFLQIDM